MTDHEDAFERARPLLEGIAYRMLGTLAEAQDVVQETFLRWRSVEADAIRDPRAWLVTVCTRLSTNVLKSARKRRETYVGTWLPEPSTAPDAEPGARLELDQTISLAFLVALESLSPLERAAFLLHDVFDYEFAEIARILERSAPTCRKLASRARANVRRRRPRPAASTDEHQRAVMAFVEALRAGDVVGIERSLAGDARLYADGGGRASASAPLTGARAIARLYARVLDQYGRAGARIEVHPCWLNQSLGAIIVENGTPTTALSFEVTSGLIDGLFAQRNPEKLQRLALELDDVTRLDA